MATSRRPRSTGPIADTADSTPWAATDSRSATTATSRRSSSTPATPSSTTRPERPRPDRHEDHDRRPGQRRQVPLQDADDRPPPRRPGRLQRHRRGRVAQRDRAVRPRGELVRRSPSTCSTNGYAYVGISAQRVGVNFLRGWDAARYGDLDVSARDNGGVETITNDALSYDIFSIGHQGAPRTAAAGVDPLGPLAKPDTVLASGQSQSGSRLSTYYNKVQPIHDVVDAFLITVSSSAAARRRDGAGDPGHQRDREPDPAHRAGHDELPAVGGRRRLPLPADGIRQPADIRSSAISGTTLSATCTKYPLSRVQWPFVANSAIAHLVDWANGGAAAPTAPRGEYQASPADANNQLERDDLGIAKGGIRLPEVTVPARLNTGINSTAGPELFSLLCGLYGSTEDLTRSVLLSLYDDYGDYIDQVKANAEEVADEGFLLDQDVPRLIAQHEQVYTLRPTKPEAERQEEAERSQVQALVAGQHGSGYDVRAPALRRRRRDVERRQGRRASSRSRSSRSTRSPEPGSTRSVRPRWCPRTRCGPASR